MNENLTARQIENMLPDLEESDRDTINKLLVGYQDRNFQKILKAVEMTWEYDSNLKPGSSLSQLDPNQNKDQTADNVVSKDEKSDITGALCYMNHII